MCASQRCESEGVLCWQSHVQAFGWTDSQSEALDLATLSFSLSLYFPFSLSLFLSRFYFLCLSVCLSLCLSVCLSFCLSVSLPIFLFSISLSSNSYFSWFKTPLNSWLKISSDFLTIFAVFLHIFVVLKVWFFLVLLLFELIWLDWIIFDLMSC